MHFEKAFNDITNYTDYIAEHHYGEFSEKTLNSTIESLLDKLGKDEKNKNLYKRIEDWMKEKYPDHVESEKNESED